MKAMSEREDSIFNRAHAVADRFDNARWSPRSLGYAVWSWGRQRRDQIAARDAEWAAIEARRDTGRDGFKVLLSDDLTLDDWDRQIEIEDRVAPATALDRLALTVCQWEAIKAVLAARTLASRVRRGWAPRDCWGLGHWVCRSLGHAMLYLAANNQSWPGNDEFPTPEVWDAALRKHGETLAAYDDMNDESAVAAAESLRWVADHLGDLWD